MKCSSSIIFFSQDYKEKALKTWDFSPLVLWNSWHVSLCKFKAYSMVVWITHKIIATIGPPDIHLLIQIQFLKREKKGKKVFSVIRTHSIYSFNNICVCVCVCIYTCTYTCIFFTHLSVYGQLFPCLHYYK